MPGRKAKPPRLWFREDEGRWVILDRSEGKRRQIRTGCSRDDVDGAAKALETYKYGFTTNVEYGLFVKSGKIILGYPPRAQKMKYLDHLARKYNVPVFHTMEETLDAGIALAHQKHVA